MIVVDIQNLQSPLSVAELMGEGGSEQTLQAINNLCGMNSGTVYSDAASTHLRMTQSNLQSIVNKLITVRDIVQTDGAFTPIISREQLCYVPEDMYMPILQMPQIRELHKEGKIYGFGIPADAVPDEDIWGRLTNNGRVEIVPGEKGDLVQSWTWRSSDPLYTTEDLNAVRDTRHFITEFLEEQMAEGGDNFDPTNYPEEMNVKIK